MTRFRTLVPRILVATLTAALLGATCSWALVVPQPSRRFDALVIPDPSAIVAPETVTPDAPRMASSAREAWHGFTAAHGGAWDVFLDARSGAPSLVQGQGIPFIPGTGNALVSAQPVTTESLAASLRAFIGANSALLRARDAELILSKPASDQLAPESWKVVFDRVVDGVPVLGERYMFYIGHGNLIAFGATRWSEINTAPVPSLSAEEARAALRFYMGIPSEAQVTLIDPGTLAYLPMAADASSNQAFSGPVGAGYRTALVWTIAMEVDGEPGTWEAMVDAHTGSVLKLEDGIKYAQVKGGVFPLTNDAICPTGCEQANFPMPYANVVIDSTTQTSSSMGSFTCTPGGSTAITTLSAQYVRVVDNCGSVVVTTTCDADLDLKSSSGTDCAVPAGTSSGNTHSARSSFYHLNRIKEHARAWLPSNAWLPLQLRDNVNINLTCNAFWNSGGSAGTVNFYRSGGGCRNTGEIASIFLHEWGHGLDQNDGGSYDNPTEAYADTTSFLLTHLSCIGRGFTGSNCTGYGNACLTCTGVRDQDWNQHSTHLPQTPENWPASCPSGSGPCGRELHCEAYLPGETLWDLAARDLPASGLDAQTSWQVADRLWYKSRTGSGGNAYGCGSPATNRSCGAGTWFTQLRTIDDDDGNLANGTPHAAAIFAAFNRHNIPCGTSADAANQSTTVCPSLVAPVLSATPFGSNNIALSWTAVPGAANYNVLRNDQGCGWGHTIVTTVAGTSFLDTNLPAGLPVYYAIQAVGSNTACTGLLSTCSTATATVCGNGAVEAGEQCDDSNTANGDCCSSTCQFEASGASCGSPTSTTCTAPDTCNGAGSCQANNASNGTACTDGNACTVPDTCQAGACVAGPPPNCDDGNPCTNDSCSPASGCQHANNAAPCNDGNACTTSDVCSGGGCTGGPPPNCSDGNPCTDDSCSPPSGCQHANNTAPCSDGNACTTNDACAGGVCTGGAPANCGDANVCTTDACDSGTGCTHTLISCDDGDACTDDSCDSVTGCAHAFISCDDENACTKDVCDTIAGCQHSGVVCDDANACTVDNCDMVVGCTHMPGYFGEPCNDFNACTSGDACGLFGVCEGTPVGPPSEVTGQVFSTKTSQEWSVANVGGGPGPVYQVARGIVGEYPLGSGGSETCLAAGQFATTLATPQDPPVGTAYWYAVRANNACGTGTYGYASSGSPRMITTCP